MKQIVDMDMLTELLKKLYGMNPVVVTVREMLQNSKDAGAKNISISVDFTQGYAYVVCNDDGSGMTLDVIENRFMTIGNPAKELQEGATGRFGVGIKVAINSTGDWYVKTNQYEFDSTFLKDPDKQPDISANPIKGTEIGARFQTDWYNRTIDQVMQMIYFSDVEVHLRITKFGEVICDDPFAGIGSTYMKPVAEDDDYAAFACASIAGCPKAEAVTGINVYRMNGLVQFFSKGRDRLLNLVFDLKKRNGKYPLTPSRESLDWNVQYAVNSIISKYDVDAASTTRQFNEPDPVYKKIDGRTLRGKRGVRPPTAEEVKQAILNITRVSHKGTTSDEGQFVALVNGACAVIPQVIAEYGSEDEIVRAVLEIDDPSLLEQVESMEITPHEKKISKTLLKDYQKPASKSAQKADINLLWCWQAMLEEVCDPDDRFGIGLTSKSMDEHGARIQYDGDTYYILNPRHFDTPGSVHGKIMHLWSLACHEAAHRQYSIHDEYFASHHARIMAESADIVSINWKTFEKKLQGK